MAQDFCTGLQVAGIMDYQMLDSGYDSDTCHSSRDKTRQETDPLGNRKLNAIDLKYFSIFTYTGINCIVIVI